MRCDELTERIGDRVTGALAERDLAALREHLAACPGCAAEAAAIEALWRELDDGAPVPSARLRARFERMLEREAAPADGFPDASRFAGEHRVVEATAERRAVRRPAGTLVLAASIAGSLGAGIYLGWSSAGRRGGEDTPALHDEIRSLRAAVTLALLAEPSASERLSGVAYGRELQSADDRVAEALYTAFLEDPNVNVRLAALDALRERAARPEVRTRLLEAIPLQDSPLVQLSAIDVVLEHGSAAPRADVERLAESPGLDTVARGYLLDRLERSPR